MFEQWFKFWRDWMSWWLPGGDTPADKRSDESAQQQPPAKDAGSGKSADAATQPATDAPVGSAAAPSSTSSTSQGGSDDLTAIKGIGPAIARKLEAAGVRSFADLAAADPNDLADKIASRPVTAERVRTWISEARTRT